MCSREGGSPEATRRSQPRGPRLRGDMSNVSGGQRTRVTLMPICFEPPTGTSNTPGLSR